MQQLKNTRNAIEYIVNTHNAPALVINPRKKMVNYLKTNEYTDRFSILTSITTV